MDDPLLVCRFECLGNLCGDEERLIERNRALGNAICECRPFDELQDERVRAARILEAVNRGNVWMIEGGKDLRFALKRLRLLERAEAAA